MRIRGGQHIAATSGGVAFGGWARAALALAMALLFLGQSVALQRGRADAAHGFSLLAQKCERPEAAPLDGAPDRHAPAGHHDCMDCLARVFSAALETRFDIHIAPALAGARIASPPDILPRAPVRWRAAHPARAPPQFS